jgi:modulator of FtsH protease
MSSYESAAYGRAAVDRGQALLGQVMGLVAFTLGFMALGAYIGRDWSGGAGIAVFILAFGCIFGLRAANNAGREQLAMGLLFALGLCLGAAIGPVLAYYASANPGALWESAACTAGFTAALGSYGYATRRDLSGWARVLFWALLALIVFGIVATFVAIPSANIIWAVLGLVIFGGFTIFDFNRLRRSGSDQAVPIAASIFLDVANVFLFFLQLFGGNGRR